MALERTAAHFWSLGGFLTRGKKKEYDQDPPPSMVFNGARKYKYQDLCEATNNFNSKRRLGLGGVRNVYRGVLKDGSCVAVKIIQNGAREEDRDFIAELGTLGYVRHRNVVPLRGWCITRKKLFLVYELMPNGSIDQVLFDKRALLLDWGRRYQLVCGLAEGLLYLHEGLDTPIVHRDLKASNVMVDSDWNARLGDFGLARLIYAHSGVVEDRPPLPHLYTARFGNATGAGGTFGYTAPECFHGRSIPTLESDVFSFGLVVLEIVCGRRALDYAKFPDSPVLVDWVRNLQERLWLAVDEKLGKAYQKEEAIRLLQVGLLCSHSEPTLRPNMRQVVHMCFETLDVPKLPSFSSLIPYQTLLKNAMSCDSSTKSSGVASSACLSLTDKELLSNDGFGVLVGLPREYSWREIHTATQNFSQVLGRKGFGTVYEGTLSDGSRVAVKRMQLGWYGNFFTEIKHLGRIRHKSLMSLRGWCLKGGEAYLIFEYMPNGTVEQLLHATTGEAPWLGWDERFKIVAQVAEALLYLHEGCQRSTVHLNVTSSNVVLDKDLNARLGDLGIASFADDFDGRIRGTLGYLAPEMYSCTTNDTNISPAVDVYSFGMLVLEVVSGKRPWDQRNDSQRYLCEFIWQMFVQDTLELGIDAKLRQSFETPHYLEEAMFLLRLGLLCVQREQCRPTMRVVTDIIVGAAPPPPMSPDKYFCWGPTIDKTLTNFFGPTIDTTPTDSDQDSCAEEEVFCSPR